MRRFPSWLALVLLATSFALSANAQGVSNPRQWVEQTLKVYMERRGPGLYDVLKKETAIGQYAANELEKIRSKFELELDAFGVPHSFEFVSETDLGASIKTIRYIVKFRRHPLLFDFTFYKFDKTWDMVHFTYKGGNDVWNSVPR